MGYTLEQFSAACHRILSDDPGAEGRKKVDEALRQLTASLDNAFTALGDAVRDPAFGQRSKQAAASLTDALSVTFSEVSERIKAKQEGKQDKDGDGPASA